MDHSCHHRNAGAAPHDPAVDDLDCSNLDKSFTNYLMADILALRQMADDMEKRLTPTFNQAN